MPVGIKLIEKTSTFNSHLVKGLNVKISNYNFVNSNIPKIESSVIKDSSGVIAEFSSKRMDNGSRFEVYKQRENVLKVLKNKFGEILSFKFNGSKNTQVLTPENIIENTKNDFLVKLKSVIER